MGGKVGVLAADGADYTDLICVIRESAAEHCRLTSYLSPGI